MQRGAIRLASAFSCALAIALGASTAHAALDFAPCPQRTGVACATLTVPLDRAGAVAGTLDLRVHRLAASGPRRGVFVLLPDGPGEPGLVPVRGDATARLIRRAARGHDLVLLDPRGTGATALDCPGIAGVLAGGVPLATARARVTDCAARLGAQRVFMGTAATVEDLEQLRTELGADRLVLGGVGYGAVAALAYARAHPDRVARLVLDTPVDPEALDGLGLERLRSVPAVLREICAGRACRAASRDPVGDLTRLDRRLRTRPVSGTVALPNGRRARAGFGGPRDPRALLDLLAAGDRLPAVRAGVPAAVRSAVANDPAPLLRLTARTVAPEQPAARDAAATQLATGCRDATLPWTDATPAADRASALAAQAGALPDDAAAPFGRAAVLGGSLASLCTAWPEGPQTLPAGPLPDVPVLVLGGREDVQAPLEGVARIAARFPQATTVVVPHGGHALLAARTCARQALRRFVRGVAVGTPCARAGRPVLPPPFAPATLGKTRRAPGFDARRGRTLTAVAVALQDAVFAAQLGQGTAVAGRWRAAALRGGRATARVRSGHLTITLDRWSAVGGVTVTGTIAVSGNTVSGDPLRVRGRGARGTLQATSGFLVGFLEDEPVVLDILGLLGGGSA